MKKFHMVLVGMITIGSLSIGIAFADVASNLIVSGFLIVNGNSVVNGISQVNNGLVDINNSGLRITRDDGTQTAISLINSQKQSSFIFEDPDDNLKYTMRYTPDGTSRFQFLDTAIPGSPRVDLSINTITGFTGLGEPNPQQQLDVAGNIKVDGDVLSDGNLNIKPNGDLCLGSGCDE